MARRTRQTATAPPPAPQIQTTLGTLVEALASLRRLVQRPFPARVSYHIAKIARLVEVETKQYYAQRDAIIRELGEEIQPTDDDHKNGVTQPYHRVTPKNGATFQARTRELDDVPVTIAWAPIQADWLKNETLAPADLMTLGPLLAGELTD